MDTILEFFKNIFILASAMSFYILIGLIIAGILKQFIADDFIYRHLGKNSFSSIIKATIFGIPMPVCSCSVIPLAKSLQKEGASVGAVNSFLISAPITGVDSIIATYSFFGWLFTIYRVFTSIIIAVVVGVVSNIFIKPKSLKFSPFKPKVVSNITFNNQNNQSCSSSCCASSSKSSKSFSIKSVFNYAFNTLFSDIAKALFWGLIIGAAFSTFIPKELLENFFNNKILSYIAVLIIAMPLYVCATASLPIAASFLLSGLSPGAAFIFLSAGPATNSVTMGVVASMYGKRALYIYVGVIALLSIVFGLLFDLLFGSLEVLNNKTHLEELSLLDIISTIILFLLIGFYLIRKK